MREREGSASPRESNSFDFMHFLRKNWQNRVLAPPESSELTLPSQGNCGSATVDLNLYYTLKNHTLKYQFYKNETFGLLGQLMGISLKATFHWR